MALTWKEAQSEEKVEVDAPGPELEVEKVEEDALGVETEATLWMRGKAPFGVFTNCSNPLMSATVS